ncbi:Oligopeptide transport system permease protein OppC [Mycoplasmopsis meleagridis]|uniref:Oligopeptide transport system permease protein OppC n=1 Tax=Mycoplasmopsis meleagridis ATCC 25294 TaxID=1264554 RepID=A0A0F5H118_9BACT|nr:ABC transporter permease [Mycoplasmopsis meleagridis]KKB26835.1 Oligopeptide transport system permease protein OppC [Mycoplasmopsis meleagridis ATCC 25294]KUH47382.1 peptide ABC transporter permease [Mycoplasmopsis meleagridis]OAD18570.1 Oligopeptide transport system permease protein OppC [Mycoplasmopsis meleagridis]VEU77426.1 Glutathione transport system permease protein gsiD [Mycoplasmopsis meleagridis]
MDNRVNEFNRKYRLSNELLDKIRFSTDENKKISSQIAGKPKKLGIEIIKRFFSNPVVIISLLVFVVVLLMSILVPVFSKIDDIAPDKQASALAFTENLPSKLSPDVVRYVNDGDAYYKAYINLSNSPYADIYNRFGLDKIKLTIDQGQIIMNYNAYTFYKLNALNGDLEELARNGKDVLQLSQSELNQLWNSYDLNSILGTTTDGYDVWTRTWYASWRAIWIALVVSVIQALVGISLGAYLGFRAGRWIDSVVMRLIDIFTSAPTLIWILIFISIMGSTQYALIFALSIVGWPGFVGTARLYVITVKNEEYISAAKAIGAKTSRQVFIHALPAVIGKLVYSFVRNIPGIILWISSLSFLGFFNEKGDTNLGQLLIDATRTTSENIWILVLPALILLAISLSLAFVALGLHDALDPRVMAKRKRR